MPDDLAPAGALPVANTQATRVELFKSLSGSAKIVCNVLWRQIADDPPVAPPMTVVEGDPNPAMTALRAIVQGINNGSDLSAHRQTLNRLLYSQEQRSQVIDQLMMVSDYKRLVELTEARNHLESMLVKSSYRGDLNPAEQLVLLSQLTSITKQVEGKVRSGAQSVSDLETLLRRIDYAANTDSEGLKKKFQQTSPQGREVIRKLTMRLQKAVKEATDIEVEAETQLP